LVVLKVAEISSFADYFLICHGDSSRQVQGIARNIEEKLKKQALPLSALKVIKKAAGYSWIMAMLSFISFKNQLGSSMTLNAFGLTPPGLTWMTRNQLPRFWTGGAANTTLHSKADRGDDQNVKSET
jgi:Uncharacterized homolog of plant Iojap protein